MANTPRGAWLNELAARVTPVSVDGIHHASRARLWRYSYGATTCTAPCAALRILSGIVRAACQQRAHRRLIMGASKLRHSHRAHVALMAALVALSLLLGPTAARRRGVRMLSCSLSSGTFALPSREELGHLSEVAESIGASACHLIKQRPAIRSAPGRRRLSADRWTHEVDAALAGHLRTIRTMLLAEQPALMSAEGRKGWVPWVKLSKWLDNAATQSDAFELLALSAPIMEAQLWNHIAM